MNSGLPQGAELKELYVGVLRLMADSGGMPVCSCDFRELANRARLQILQRRRLERLIESMSQLSPNHRVLNNPRRMPFVPVRDGDDVVWLVTDDRFLQAAKAHDWKSAEEWLTVALCQWDYIA